MSLTNDTFANQFVRGSETLLLNDDASGTKAKIVVKSSHRAAASTQFTTLKRYRRNGVEHIDPRPNGATITLTLEIQTKDQSLMWERVSDLHRVLIGTTLSGAIRYYVHRRSGDADVVYYDKCVATLAYGVDPNTWTFNDTQRYIEATVTLTSENGQPTIVDSGSTISDADPSGVLTIYGDIVVRNLVVVDTSDNIHATIGYNTTTGRAVFNMVDTAQIDATYSTWELSFPANGWRVGDAVDRLDTYTYVKAVLADGEFLYIAPNGLLPSIKFVMASGALTIQIIGDPIDSTFSEGDLGSL